MAITPNYDLDVDTSLGGADASDYVISSQKAVKTYVDNHSGGGTVDQTFDGTSTNAQSGVAIETALTDGSLDLVLNESLTVGNANLFYDVNDDILSINGYSSMAIDAPITIAATVTLYTETDPETGDNILYITDDITSDTVTFSSQGGISVDTSTSGGEFTYNGSEVATLSDIPSIPTVNNATLTIQKNGTTVNTFTANASTDVTANITVPTDLGDLTNNAGYTKNVGTVTSVNNVLPVNGNVSLTIPTATDVQINGTSITSSSVANIVTNTAYNASSNKIATMSDIPDSDVFIAEYGVTTQNELYTAYISGKVIICPYYITSVSGNYYQIHYLDRKVDGGGWSFTHTRGKQTSLLTLTNGGTWQQQLIYNLEDISNKVTSISSSSTDAQYPSAKLLYDQLALKQNTSTAVTHTQNTAVGDSTTPVYIASNGTATSTGLSIASSRFDGQWVISQSILVSSDIELAINTGRTFDLSSYLPNDNYNYEVLVAAVAQSTSTSGSTLNVSVYSDLITNTDDIKLCVGRTRASNTIICGGNAIIPIGTGRTIGIHQANISGTASAHVATITNFRAMAYRRIGTNS